MSHGVAVKSCEPMYADMPPACAFPLPAEAWVRRAPSRRLRCHDCGCAIPRHKDILVRLPGRPLILN
eukprot:366450-Chlamydomonas_euryale.AAC.6